MSVSTIEIERELERAGLDCAVEANDDAVVVTGFIASENGRPAIRDIA